MKTRFALIAVIVVAIGTVAGGLFGRLPARTYAAGGLTTEKIVAAYKEAIALIDEGYIRTVDRAKPGES